MDTFDILVIILSICMLAMLVLAIVTFVMVIRLLQKINEATDKARLVVQSVESFTSNLKSVANGSFAGAMAIKLLKLLRTKSNKKGK